MSEEYDEEFVDETAEEAVSDIDPQAGTEFVEDDSPSEEESSVEEQAEEFDLDPQIRALGRDIYGRYGNLSGEVSTLTKTIESLADVVRNQHDQQQEKEESSSLYAKMEPDQRKAVDELFNSHPSIKKLNQMADQVESSKMAQVEQELGQNQQLFASAMNELKEKYGQEAATPVAEDLYQLAVLTKWDLTHPAFQKRVQDHDQRLGDSSTEKKETRQRVSSERGNTKATKSRPRTARRKGADGKPYYDNELAFDIAMEESRSASRRK